MSMISGLIDELRQMADGQATYRDAKAVMLEAADTIWQLRDDLQRANAAVQDAEHDESMAWDRVRKAEAENAKLRELCRRYCEYVSQDRCEGCVYKMRCNDGLIDECWQLSEIRNLARELGIEVNG